MVDTGLLVKMLRERGHQVESCFRVPENAGGYELLIDSHLYTLDEARALLERDVRAA